MKKSKNESRSPHTRCFTLVLPFKNANYPFGIVACDSNDNRKKQINREHKTRHSRIHSLYVHIFCFSSRSVRFSRKTSPNAPQVQIFAIRFEDGERMVNVGQKLKTVCVQAKQEGGGSAIKVQLNFLLLFILILKRFKTR